MKAFATVCHKTLLAKLDHYGIRGPVQKLLDSFLKRMALSNCSTQSYKSQCCCHFATPTSEKPADLEQFLEFWMVFQLWYHSYNVANDKQHQCFCWTIGCLLQLFDLVTSKLKYSTEVFLLLPVDTITFGLITSITCIKLRHQYNGCSSDLDKI